MAVLGAILGHAISAWTGWLGAGIGAVVGLLVGVILYNNLKEKQKPD